MSLQKSDADSIILLNKLNKDFFEKQTEDDTSDSENESDYLINTSTSNIESNMKIDNDNESELNLLQDLTTLCNVNGVLDLKKYDKKEILQTNSSFMSIKDNDDHDFIVRKSSICWLLNKGNHKLSSDRLQRVKDSEIIKLKKNESW